MLASATVAVVPECVIAPATILVTAFTVTLNSPGPGVPEVAERRVEPLLTLTTVPVLV